MSYVNIKGMPDLYSLHKNDFYSSGWRVRSLFYGIKEREGKELYALNLLFSVNGRRRWGDVR